MTPPEALVDDTGKTPPAVSVRLEVLKKRADFLAAARAKRAFTKSMVVQARVRADDSTAIRVGFTCSKKVGNAVKRNFAKRRLREAARAVLGRHGKPGWDYVLIGKANATADRRFDLLKHDLVLALEELHP